jgi:hypothetical protein
MFVGFKQGINRENKGKLPDRLSAWTAIRIVSSSLGFSNLPQCGVFAATLAAEGNQRAFLIRPHGRHEANE